jgi:trehalose 6-phosphate synthase
VDQISSASPFNDDHGGHDMISMEQHEPAVRDAPGECELVVVANRLPVCRKRRGGREAWETSPGGLVSALMPILRRARSTGRAGAWIGWCGARDESFGPFEHEDVWNLPINLSSAQVDGHYDGMANGTLWPLYHDVVRPAAFRRTWWREYERANRAFADAAVACAAPGAVVWVQDYHLHLVPGMIRQRRPDLRIGYFLHTPFPNGRLFAQLPWRGELMRGTLGADLVGFQTPADAVNFEDAARRYGGATPAPVGVRIGGRTVHVDAFPISIDAQRFDELARSPTAAARATRLRRSLDNRTILLGVDRMDYTKGIDARLRAFRELLRSGAVKADDVVMIQSAVPTRERVDDYAELRSSIEELVGQINGEFGAVGRSAVEYRRQSLPTDELVALYCAADVMLVTPMRDGMNLIAKEFVASRHDGRGVLVLSEFAGAAHELSQAIPVNPHDLDGFVEAMVRAVRMDEREAKRRMAAMRRVVRERDVYAWAESFLTRLDPRLAAPAAGIRRRARRPALPLAASPSAG